MPSQRRGRFTACILGHSFVRRLHDAIACEDHDVAHRAPDSLRVDRLFSRIDIFGRSGYTVSELRHDVLAAGQQRPDLVIINCGSNDLCQERCDVEQVARELMSYADYLRISFGVRLVMLMGVIWRTRCHGVSSFVFSARAAELNRRPRDMSENRRGVLYMNMRGFWSPDGSSELPVSAYSSDGIHPGPDPTTHGFRKYRRNIRRCLIVAAAKMDKRPRIGWVVIFTDMAFALRHGAFNDSLIWNSSYLFYRP